MTAMHGAGLYTDEGLRVLLAEDFYIYVLNESDGLIYVYCTEMWPSWLEASPVFDQPPVLAMIPFAHHYTPERLAKSHLSYCEARGTQDQMTFSEWEAEHKGGAA